jgi:hypothetical protein
MLRCPNCSTDISPGADDCARCGAIFLGDGRFELPKRRDPSGLAEITSGQVLTLLALFGASVFLSLVLWVMAVPGSGDFEGYFRLITWCFVLSHVAMAALALRYLSARRRKGAAFALIAAPFLAVASSLLLSAAVYGF